MWSPQLLLVVIVALLIHANVAQLGNSIFSAEDILDIYEPLDIEGNTTRIVGGNPITITQTPWQIALYKNGYFTCGGSIISRNWVLTAAHCVKTGGNFQINAGSTYYKNGGQIRIAEVVVVNSGFSFNTLDNDLALIRVRSPFKWNSRVRPMTLARPRRQLPPRFFISGWGTTSDNGKEPDSHLRGITIQNVMWSDCKRIYSAAGIVITKIMICAASPGKYACHGDSGGALVNKNIQYGIVSFGISCANPNFPDVFKNVREEYDWITGVIRRRGGEMPTFG